MMIGGLTSVISGRIAYTLGLEGPAVTVDTACSSALVSTHLACQALRSGECTMALAGGVAIMATPGAFAEFSRQRGLAEDGRCKAFSADADGIGWGEGAGVLVLERLSDARRNGHQVLAVIRASATNQDGASNGLTAPNGPSQQRVIRAALASAELAPADVDAVEAHGTGTTLGDPIEAQALLATYGQDRQEGRPLWLGSVKSNIGHTQTAAGAAGVIKMVLALRHGMLPRTLHAERPSPHIDWQSGDVRLLTEAVPWPADTDHPRRAGVSAFGVSGTNAHVILEEAPPPVTTPTSDTPDGPLPRAEAPSERAEASGASTFPRAEARVPYFGLRSEGATKERLSDEGEVRDPERAEASGASTATTPPVLAAGTFPYLVTARSTAGLAAQAGRLASWMAARPGLDPADVAWSLATTRSAHGHRAIVIGADQQELAAGLVAVAAGQPPVVNSKARIISGIVPVGGAAGKVVFVFPGQGAQWAGMGTELAAASPVFAARLAECSAALEPYTGWKVEDVLAGADGAPGLDRVDVVQPALWAVMVSLAAAWQAAGVEPDAVAGHSQGEIAAAVVAGVLSLDDAARVVALRSKALTALSGRGGMASLALPAAAVGARLAPWDGRVQVAAVNGPTATVVSGDPDALAELVAGCEADGIRARILPVDYASHGPQVAELEREITAALDGVTPRRARIPMISAMTGEYLQGPEADAGYWYASLRAPVEFERSVRTLARAGHRVFIEASPHPVLSAPVTEALEALSMETLSLETGADAALAVGIVTGSLRRDDGGPGRFLSSLAEAYVAGVPVAWTRVLPPARTVELPTYAFQHQRFWPAPVPVLAGGASGGTGGAGAGGAGDGSGTQAEALFWAAVEGGNVQALSDALAVGSDRPFHEVLPVLASWRRRGREETAVAGWRYRVSWVPVPEAGPGTLTGTWLLAAPGGHDGLAGDLAAAMTAAGGRVITVAVTGGLGRDEMAALVRDAFTGQTGTGQTVPGEAPLAGVVSLLALDETPLPDTPAVPSGLAATLTLIQGLGDAEVDAPLWVVTSGAVGAVPGEVPARPVQAQAWGLGRTAGVEHPDRWGGLIDLPPAVVGGSSASGAAPDERAWARLCAVLRAHEEEEVAIRPAGLFARRLVRALPASMGRPGGAGRDWAPRGTVLVTGAGGAIGPDLSQWLAGCGASRVVLAGRRGPQTPGAAVLAAGLAGAGTEVRLTACDVTDREQAAGMLDWAGTDGLPISTVIHGAVAVNLAPVAETTVADLALALGAKAGGAAVLDELTAGVREFILFSSIAATWGVAEHGTYAAANAYLDALAENRWGRGLPATSVAWGVWSSGGRFDEADPNNTGPDNNGGAGDGRPLSLVPRRLARQGLRLLDPERALSALGQVLTAGETVTAVADVDWDLFAPIFTAARPWRLLDELPEARKQAVTAAPAAEVTGGLAAELAGLGRAERERVVTALVRKHAAAVLGFAGDADVESARAFRDMGFDSLTAIELRNRLNAATGLTLPSTVVFDYPSPAMLARMVTARLTGTDPAGTGEAARPVTVAAVGPGEPVAIVGLGCRYPGGADTPEALWELLASGGDAVGGFPTDRGWDIAGLLDPDPDNPGTSHTSEGGFVAGAGEFDPGFFGISPREALAMDPQQRLLLQTAWEAVERAGIDPLSLRGSATGVFAGAASSGYGVQAMGTEGLEGHLITGNVTSVISGRISYALGLEGPAVTVDTACSSALVALHLAAQSLRAGECDLALAGGVMVIADPAEFIGFSRQRALAADGRCKAFAASADGMGLAEGAGMIALERLSDARRNGHPVLAVVAGSAINQDGASNGLSAPNGPAQQRVIAAALASAGLSPADVDAVEGHGTGTTLGDPIEAQALIAAYGQDRPEGRPLWLGSVKSNIGHAQQAAGAVGIIKMVLALGHELLPRTLHVQEPSPHVDWSAGDVRLLAEAVPWPAAGAGEAAGDGVAGHGAAGRGRVRRAGVSSFGISGTNAHIILEEAPPPLTTSASDTTNGALPRAEARVPYFGLRSEGATKERLSDEGEVRDPERAEASGASTAGQPVPELRVLATDAGSLAWPVSGKTAAALGAQAAKLAAWIAARQGAAPAGPIGPAGPASLAWSLATTRSVLEHRAVIIGAGRDDLTVGLDALASGQPAANVISGAVPPGGDPGKVVFVFPGQGSQWAGMGTELAAASPVFAARLAECSAALEPYTGWKVEDVLAASARPDTDSAPGLDQVDVVQPALWAVMVSLAATWQAAGVEPDAVAGHSQGEIAAAVIAGILTLDDAARVVALRSRALTALAGRGAMASLALSAEAVRERLDGTRSGQTQVAAVNGPNATVISGEPDAVAAFAEACEADGIRARVLPVDYASHGPQVEELERDIRFALDGLEPHPARIPMISAMTGEFLAGPEADAGYWYASLRAPVEFQRSIETLARDGHRVFIEASPHPVLTAPVAESLEAETVQGAVSQGTVSQGTGAGTVTGTLRRDDGGPARLLASLAQAHVAGVPVDWARVLPPVRATELPTYAFQTQRYWPERKTADGTGEASAGTPSASSAAEARFWAAIEGGDLQELADTLSVDEERPLREVLPALASWRRRDREDSAVAGWRYQVTWAPAPDQATVATGPAAGELHGTWLLLVPAGQETRADAIAAALNAGDARLITVGADCATAGRTELATAISTGISAGIGTAVDDAAVDDAGAGDAEAVTGIVSLLALAEGPLPGLPEVPAGLAATAALVQALGDAGIGAPLWVVTSGAVAAAPGETPAKDQAMTWGYGRVVALEHPDRWGGLIDIPPLDRVECANGPAPTGSNAQTSSIEAVECAIDPRETGRDGLAARVRAVLVGQGEDQVAIRSTGTLVRRLVRATSANQPLQEWAPSGAVLVTGGTGGVGGHVARWLASRAADQVILTSRSGPAAPGVPALAAELAAAGTAVRVSACDAASRDELAGLIASADACGQPVTGVFHAAGAGHGGVVTDVTANDLRISLAAKAAGAAYLDELTAGRELNAFVLFSSGAAVWGSGGLAGYAAANACLDALAEDRRARGLAATSVAWGLWGGGGMGEGEAGTQLQRLGVREMDPALAIASLARVMDADQALVTVADVDWARFAPVFTSRRPSPLLADLPEAGQALDRAETAAEARGDTTGGSGLAGQLAGLPAEGQQRLLTDLVRDAAAAVLGHASPQAVEPGRAFKDLGFDSVTAVDLRNRLTAATGLQLPATLVYDHPTPEALAQHLRTRIGGQEADYAVVLEELAKLESILSRMPLESEEKAVIAARLEGISRGFRVADAAPAADDAELESATDDEMFDLVEQELHADFE
jgi:candicidin polyketide synthase FscD